MINYDNYGIIKNPFFPLGKANPDLHRMNPKKPSRGSTPDTVLVVDDEPDVQRQLTFILERAGLRAVTSSHAEEALEQCRRESPEVILLDLLMPGIDGYELCGMIRAEFAHVPIIVITGAKDSESCSRIMTNGANDFLSKPLQAGEVLIRVKNALQMSRLNRQLEIQKANQDQVQSELDRVTHQVEDLEVVSGEQHRREVLQQLLEGFEEEDEISSFTI